MRFLLMQAAVILVLVVSGSPAAGLGPPVGQAPPIKGVISADHVLLCVLDTDTDQAAVSIARIVGDNPGFRGAWGCANSIAPRCRVGRGALWPLSASGSYDVAPPYGRETLRRYELTPLRQGKLITVPG